VSPTLLAIKWCAVGCATLSLTLAAGAIALTHDSPLHRLYFRYTTSLAQRLRILFIELPPVRIVLGQLLAMLGAVVLAIALRMPILLALVALAAVLPHYWLEHAQTRRRELIEQKLEGFVLALANALRASPSPGRALAMVQPVTPAPLDRELTLVLREMRVGSTLEQALANLSARVRSFQLDAAMSGLLIGRQTGGNVPHILDATAQTLREMARLQGVLRSKTADGRAQANVLTAVPLVLIFAFDFVSPGYFKPLSESATGFLIMVIALGLWLSSVVMTRRIMAVEL
jgi:tight adherence protein B